MTITLYFFVCVWLFYFIFLHSTPYESDFIIFLLQNDVCLLQNI